MASISAEPQDVVLFFQRLANDDAFRAQLESDPGPTLAGAGIIFSDAPSALTLPPKKVFADALAAQKVHAAAGVTPQSTFYAFLAFFAFMV